MISTLSISPDDDELDVALKLSQVDLYTRRLRERTRRKRLVRDFQLVSVFFTNQRNKQKLLSKLAKEKKEFTERLRWTAQFYGRAEQAAVVSGLWRERELRVRLAELHRYRLAGVTRLEECAHYEQHAQQRKPHAHDVRTRHIALAPATLIHFWQWVPGQQPDKRSNADQHAAAKKKRRRKRLKFHQPKVHTGRKYRMWMLQKELMQRRLLEASADN